MQILSIQKQNSCKNCHYDYDFCIKFVITKTKLKCQLLENCII